MKDYLMLIAAISTAALIWRALLLDHPALLSAVERVPFVGGALRCGFCSTLWLSLAGTCAYNPFAADFAGLPQPVALLVSWLIVGAGALFLRNATACLIEANGALTHLHRSSHESL
jgi:hypothetical protein